MAFDSVFRWEDAEGRIAHGPVQSVWNHRIQQFMKTKRLERSSHEGVSA
jgi:hypothetical protein